jgi:hypothetical protein
VTAPFETTFTVTPHPDKITQEKLRKGVEFFKKNDSLPPILLFDLRVECSVTVKTATKG